MSTNKKLVRLVDNFEKEVVRSRGKRPRSRAKTLQKRWLMIMNLIFVIATVTVTVLALMAVLTFEEKPSVAKMVSDINVIKNLL